MQLESIRQAMSKEAEKLDEALSQLLISKASSCYDVIEIEQQQKAKKSNGSHAVVVSSSSSVTKEGKCVLRLFPTASNLEVEALPHPARICDDL